MDNGNSYHEEEFEVKEYDAVLMRRFIKYLAPYKWLAVLSLLFILAEVGMSLTRPIILGRAIDGPVAAHDKIGLIHYSLIFLGSILILGIFEFANLYTTNLLGQNIMRDLRVKVFSHLQRLPLSFYDKNPVGRLIVRVTNDVENLNELLTAGLVSLFSDIFLLTSVLVVMFVISWRLALVTMAASPLLIIVVRIFKNLARKSYREMRKRIAALNAYLAESIMGIKTIAIFSRQAKRFNKFDELNSSYRDAGVGAIWAYSLFWPSIEFFRATSISLLLWYGGVGIVDKTISFGLFMTFWYCAQIFFEPVMDLSEKYNILQSAMASAERIFKLLDTPPEDGAKKVSVPIKGEIEFRNVSFSYDGEHDVLEDVSFKVRRGEKIGIVGLTGGGKTTLIHLIAGFYPLKRGQILIDGIDIRDYDLNELRRQIGIVLQDVFLFSGSALENIRLGNKNINEDRVQEVAKYVNAHDFIMRLKGGYNSNVGERGVSLSSGQRQLLSFARVLAFDPRIIILDEATSNIDSHTESLVQDAITKLLADRTSLVIAHRLSTIQNVDKIIVIHKGRIRESGTHSQLLAKSGIYQKLYQLQYTESVA